MSIRSVAFDGPELGREFFERDVREVAVDLIGCSIEHAGAGGLIVETEAYHQSEPACHGYIGETKRNAPLFGPAGHAYVYLSYGIHDMLNFVTGPVGEGAAVLIRALEPVAGIELMKERRGTGRDVDLCSGPGKLAQALAIKPELNGVELQGGPIRLGAKLEHCDVVSGPRIGITKATDLDWRFAVRGSRFVSRPRIVQ